MTTAKEVKTSVNINNNSSSQNSTNLDDQHPQTWHEYYRNAPLKFEAYDSTGYLNGITSYLAFGYLGISSNHHSSPDCKNVHYDHITTTDLEKRLVKLLYICSKQILKPPPPLLRDQHIERFFSKTVESIATHCQISL